MNMPSQYTMSNENEEDKSLPKVNTGNASNPSPQENIYEQTGDSQLLDKKAEKYIREAGNIEDTPDPEEEAEADKVTKHKDI